MTHTSNDQNAKRGPAEHQGAGQLTAEQVEQVRKFIEEAGGVDNARQAIEALEKLRPAA
jgi:hypothetical protein